MGKRKPKKRKNKLARPPKRRANPLPVIPPLPAASMRALEGAESYLDNDGDDLDAPTASPWTPKKERPFGTVDPSLYESTRYKKFRNSVVSLRATLPDSVETFATYDLPEEKDRRWLTRYCIKKEAGTLPGWQQVILEKAGFNWVRGYPPTSRKEKPAWQGPGKFEKRWQASYEAFADFCKSQKKPILGPLLCGENHYKWFRAQTAAFREDRLSGERLDKLRALPFDFDGVLADKSFGHWRKAFHAYAAGELLKDGRWAKLQAKSRKAGELPQWRIDALDTLGFDWTVVQPRRAKRAKRTGPPKPKVDPQEKMEARWRAKLDRYCELKAEQGGSHPLPLHVDDSLRPWISRMRMLHNKGQLRPEIVKEFKERGFDFDGKAALKESWEASFEKLRAFKKQFGHLRVPSSYCDDPGLGKWLANQQEAMRKGKLKPEKLRKMRALGVPPRQVVGGDRSKSIHISRWLKGFRQLEAILQADYGGRLPEVGRFPDELRTWLKRQAKKLHAGKLEPWQVAHLERIGFDPEHIPERPPQIDWEDRLARLRRFIQKHGHAHVPRGYADKKLNAFVEGIRDRKRRGRLTRREIRELRAVGFVFAPNREVSPRWRQLYEVLKDYYEAHGNSHVPRYYAENQPLAEFVAQQRQRGRKGLLLEEHIRLLDALDFRWVGEHPVGKDALNVER